MNTIDITPIVNAALALIGAGVSVFLIPWLKKQTTEAQRQELTAWVKIGVAAAAQLYVGPVSYTHLRDAGHHGRQGARETHLHQDLSLIHISVSTPQEKNIIIPTWTKVTPDSENYFATDEIAVLQAGAYSVEVPTSAVSNGTKF